MLGERFTEIAGRRAFFTFMSVPSLPINFLPAPMILFNSGKSGRDAKPASFLGLWWPVFYRQIVIQARACKNCPHLGENEKYSLHRKNSENCPSRIRLMKSYTFQDIEIGMGPFAETKKRFLLVAIDQYSSWPTLKYAKSTQISVVKNSLLGSVIK